jgi:hypothetical protein
MTKVITIIADIVKWALVAIQGLDIFKKILEWISSFKKS